MTATELMKKKRQAQLVLAFSSHVQSLLDSLTFTVPVVGHLSLFVFVF